MKAENNIGDVLNLNYQVEIHSIKNAPTWLKQPKHAQKPFTSIYYWNTVAEGQGIKMTDCI